MFLSDWRVLLRRWYITVAGVVVTLAMCVLAMRLVPASHEMTADVLLLPPNPSAPSATGAPPNPYLNLGGLEGMADIVSRSLSDRSTAETLQKRGLTGQYQVQRDLASAAPAILMTVDDASATVAVNTLQFLLTRLPTELSRVQASSGVAPSAMITSNVITKDTQGELIRKSQIRALVVALALGLGLTFLSAALLDGYLRGRRRRPTDGDEGREIYRSSLSDRLGGAPPGSDMVEEAGQPRVVRGRGASA